MCGVVEVWASKGRHNPIGGSRGHGENSFFFESVFAPAICVAVVEVRREGREEAEEWRELAEEAVNMNFFFFFFGRLYCFFKL